LAVSVILVTVHLFWGGVGEFFGRDVSASPNSEIVLQLSEKTATAVIDTDNLSFFYMRALSGS
jgi:hypothetical protein